MTCVILTCLAFGDVHGDLRREEAYLNSVKIELSRLELFKFGGNRG